MIGASGILATVTAGLYVGRRLSRILTPEGRIQAFAFWETMTFLLEGLAFVLIGLELPEILAQLVPHVRDYILYGLALSVLVIVVRLLWVFPGTYLPRVIFPKLRKVDPKFQGARFGQYLAAVDALAKLARERFGKSVLTLAVRWVLDQGPTIALWGARHPEQLDPLGEIEGWHIDAASRSEIDAILARTITDPVSPAFMAPPAKRPAGVA